MKKVPFSPASGARARTNDPRTWADLATACQCLAGYDGLGIVFTEDLCGVDLDKCRDPETGALEPWAQAIMEALDSYSEASPSGTGIHVLLRGKLPPGRRRRGRVEAYDASSPRFFCFTGAHLAGTPSTVEHRQAALEAFHAEHLADAAPPGNGTHPTRASAALDDTDLLQVAFRADNGDRIRSLCNEPGTAGNSEGDAALAGLLAFYSGGDPVRLERFMRASARARPKWDEKRGAETWIARECQQAVERCSSFYAPGHKRSSRATVEVLLNQVESQVEPDPSPVWETVEALASLPPEDLGTTRKRLKAALGGRLNLHDLAAAITAARRGQGAPEGAVVIGRQLSEVTADAMRLLEENNSPPVLFRRSGALVRLTSDEEGRPVIGVVGVDELRRRLSDLGAFVRQTDTGPRPADPPETLARNLLAAWEHPFPGLVAVVEAPCLRPDGSLLEVPGYDPVTRLFYAPAPGLAVPPLPAQPSTAQVAAARDLLLGDLLADFPFVDAASRAGALALLLTPVVRPAIPGCVPLCLVDSPMPGTGKGLLTSLAALLATGRAGAVFPAPGDDAEWQKQILTYLAEGCSLITVDNLEGPLAAPALAYALTTERISGRDLGRIRGLAVAQRATWAATGNNVSLRGDLARRCYWVRLDAKSNRPWQRAGFRHQQLAAWAAEHRGQLLCALLTLARNWWAAGCPEPADLPPLGSFEQWRRCVGGILELAEVPGFLSNLEALYTQHDEQAAEWAAFLTAWKEVLQDRPVTARELLEAGSAFPTVGEAMPSEVLDRAGVPSAVSLGKALARRVDARHGAEGLRVVRAGDQQRAVRWKVIS